ncbi:MAG: hypothetical protein WAT17_04560 [Candidatus Saccharimonadales bacterium]|jgi:hypothetical protein
MLDANKDFEDRKLAVSEEAIEKAINYLKFHDPLNANRDYAVGLLKSMQIAASTMADASTLNFEDFVDRYNQSLKNKEN